MLHKLKKSIVRDCIINLWDQGYLTFDDTFALQAQLKKADCCTINHWLKMLKHIYLEEYPACSKLYKLS